ncbi:MAG: peptide deformylase [Desulfobacterales bacterium]|jgi:peptide deformylase|nr:peptide deformylase [Desulfobacterales bacterium]
MAILEILKYPDDFLRFPTRPVETINDAIQEIIENLADTMYQAPGVGLAANQAGIDKRIIVFDHEADAQKRKYQVLINPEIKISQGETISENEGCLSVPDLRSDVKRSEIVVVEALDRFGNKIKMETDGILSVIIQHEIDHLKGILFIDRISALKRQLYKKKIMKALKQSGKTP